MSRTLIWSQLAFDLGDQLVAENSSLWSIHAPLEGPLWVRGIAGVVSPRLVHVTVHHHASPCPSSTVQVTVFALAQGELLQQSTLLLLVQCITLNIIFTTLNMIINFKFISELVLNNSNAFFSSRRSSSAEVFDPHSPFCRLHSPAVDSAGTSQTWSAVAPSSRFYNNNNDFKAF